MKKNKLLPHTYSVYICGDSFSVAGSDTGYHYHWSVKLEQKIKKNYPGIRVVNASRVSPTNLHIALQIEKAILDPTTCFVIINASDIFHTVVPTNKIDKISKIFWKHKGIVTDEYAVMFKQPFLKYAKENGMYIGAELLDKFTTGEGTAGEQELNLYDTVGVWPLYRERKYRESGETKSSRLSNELWDHLRNYYADQFDINLQWNQDYALIEGKLYKLIAKKINFIFNLGGLADADMALLGLEQKKIIPDDLKPYWCRYNLWDFPRNSLYELPMFHITSPKDHDKIATEYFDRLVKILPTDFAWLPKDFPWLPKVPWSQKDETC